MVNLQRKNVYFFGRLRGARSLYIFDLSGSEGDQRTTGKADEHFQSLFSEFTPGV